MKRLILAGLFVATGALTGGCRERQEAETPPPAATEREVEQEDVGPVRGTEEPLEEGAQELEEGWDEGTQELDENIDLGDEAERQ